MSMYHRSASALAVVFLLSACGGALPTDPDNTLTLIAEQSFPKPDEAGISITSPIFVALKEELDPTTVNNTTVHLMPGGGHSMGAGGDDDSEDAAMLNNDPIPGDVSYDPTTKRIKFVPTIAMDQGRMYHIHTAGLKLKNGKALDNGIDTISYSFTTSHAHEFYRVEFDDFGNVKEKRYTDTLLDERVQRQQFAVSGGIETPEYTRHYGDNPNHRPTGLMTGDEVVYWQQDGATNGIQRYEVLRKGSDGQQYTVRVRFDEGSYPQTASASDPIHNVWSPGQAHGAHQISYQYEPAVDGVASPWPNNGNPSTDSTFVLDNAQLMEMNHRLPAGSTNAYQHRHIFYGDLGGDDIDFDAAGNPAPVNDRVSVYHTRDLSNYLRTHEWSLFGKGRDGVEKYGVDNRLFSTDDIAYRLRIYIYDDKGRRAQRVTFEVPRSQRNTAPYGLTKNEWLQFIQTTGYSGHLLSNYGKTSVSEFAPAFTPQFSYTATNSANQQVQVTVHSYRIYEYEQDVLDTSVGDNQSFTKAGALKKVIVWHEKNDTSLIKEQERYYTTNPTVTGKNLASTITF